MELTAGSDSRKRGLQIMKKVQGSPQPLGVTIGTERINFAVSVPGGKSCELLLYRTGSTDKMCIRDR